MQESILSLLLKTALIDEKATSIIKNTFLFPI